MVVWHLSCLLLLSLILGQAPALAQRYIELSAEIEINDWSYWFFEDENGLSARNGTPKSLFTKPATVHCVVGTNTWMMEGRFIRNANVTRWFTGINILQHSIIIEAVPAATTKRIYETSDGNPGRPVRVTDLMDLQGRICWLAFCSGSGLKREGRRVSHRAIFGRNWLPLLPGSWTKFRFSTIASVCRRASSCSLLKNDSFSNIRFASPRMCWAGIFHWSFIWFSISRPGFAQKLHRTAHGPIRGSCS